MGFVAADITSPARSAILRELLQRDGVGGLVSAMGGSIGHWSRSFSAACVDRSARACSSSEAQGGQICCSHNRGVIAVGAAQVRYRIRDLRVRNRSRGGRKRMNAVGGDGVEEGGGPA